MKQITQAEAQSIAIADRLKLAREESYCQSDWIRENSRKIADVECKRVPKTYYGEWPKGWRAEMLRASSERARKVLLDEFLATRCRILDGVIWTEQIFLNTQKS